MSASLAVQRTRVSRHHGIVLAWRHPVVAEERPSEPTPVPVARDVRPVELAVARARRGDRTALAALYESHVDAVFSHCLAFARGDRQLARDLCQESFATAFQALGELRDDASFPGWMKTICRRTCLRWAERRRVERAALERLASEPPLPRPTGEHAVAIVTGVIEACPDEALRQTASLFYRDPPHSTQEIASLLGITQTAVTTRLLRFRDWARKRMLARLAEALEDAP